MRQRPTEPRARRRRADLALLVVAAIWGLTFPLIRAAVQDLDPFVFVPARFGLATVAFLPAFVLSATARAGLRRALLPGVGLGALAWTSYLAQTVGLQAIPAGRAAFITGTAVIMVPLLSPLFSAGRPGRRDLGAAALATAGLYLLTAPSGDGFSTGDGLVLYCAAAYAAYIHLLQRTLRHSHAPVALAFVQVATITACSLATLPVMGGEGGHWSAAAWTGVAFCALFATAGSFFLQTRFQGETTPQRAALLFSMEPVFAALFAWFLLAERLPLTGALGAGLILAAVLGVEALPAPRVPATAPSPPTPRHPAPPPASRWGSPP